MERYMKKRLKWLEKMMPQGLEIIVALEDPKQEILDYPWAGPIKHADLAVRGKVPKGLIEYLPIENALEPVKGKHSLFINCIWVLPPFWGTGIAKGLINQFINEARKAGGATVLAYEGDKWFDAFEYMPAGFFRKFDFKEASRDETRLLLHLDLGAHEQPMLISPKKRAVDRNDKRVIDVFCNSQCPWSGWMAEQVKRNLRKHGDVKLNVINTDRKEVIEQFGISRGVSINGVPIIKRMASWKEVRRALGIFQKKNV
jgi:GNAT superfamily N-acetyltransferase